MSELEKHDADIADGNRIEPVADTDNNAAAEFANDLPSSNETGRDSTNNKKLKIMAMIVAGVLIMLIGLGLAVGRYSERKKAAKAEEAEKAAAQQNEIKEGNKVNIAADQANIKNSQFQPLPPPAGALDPNDPNAAMNAATPAGAAYTPATSPSQPVTVQPPPAQTQSHYQPRYNTYDSGPTPVVNYEPVQTQNGSVGKRQNSNNDAVIPYNSGGVGLGTMTAAQAPQLPLIDNSDVLIDVYGKAAAKAADQRETGQAKKFQASQLANGTASKATDKTMLLVKGTTIPCVLRTKIDSTYQGFTTCQISKDVYSANGKVLLLERGSTVFGEQNVQLNQGQARVAVLWSRIETPKGVAVDIDSPAAGQLGEMGIDASVNNHFWKRFGGAILLSVIKDASANLSTRLSKDGQDGNNNTSISNTTSTTDEMAAKILDNTINIPPTATVNQGSLIQILVARDVDFGGVYALRKY